MCDDTFAADLYQYDLAGDISGYHWVDQFERRLAHICGVKYVISTSTGTAALHLALLCVGVDRDTDVVMPSLTFAATANAAWYCGAVPHFIDCQINVETEHLEAYLPKMLDDKHIARCRAVVAVDVLGRRCNVAGLSLMANDHGLPLIEDAAEAMGEIDGMRGASAAILSFNGNKLVTTGQGGALLTDDVDIAEWALKLSTTARVQHPFLVEHERVAFNYRMPNACAAIGLAQLDRLDEMIEAKQVLRDRYRDAFEGMEGVKFLGFPWLNAISVDNRDDIIEALQNDGIEARAIFTPLHRLDHFQCLPRSSEEMPMCTETWRTLVCLPSGPGLAS